MPRRLRSFIGSIAILIYLPVYALVAMALAQGRLSAAAQPWQTLAYAALGLIWIVPIIPLISWMGRKDDR